MAKKRIFREPKEWLAILTSRKPDESVAALAKRHGIAYAQTYAKAKLFPELKKMPAWAGLFGDGKSTKDAIREAAPVKRLIERVKRNVGPTMGPGIPVELKAGQKLRITIEIV